MIILDGCSKVFKSETGAYRTRCYRIPCVKIYTKGHNRIQYKDINNILYDNYQTIYTKHIYPEFLVKYTKHDKWISIKNFYKKPRISNGKAWQ